ncbi:MAG TPA: erythromycin esterase family protein, partial [Noviherbaspirillum sp.]|uniref:erythromycin esterase family protein n=1 Tax=Noviherbaspirillum sp. TaxID=1926288 RepID=UPI002DDD517C
MADKMIIDALKHEAQIIGTEENYDALLEQIGDASIVLLGEATHGTEEFYRIRAKISEKLITERGFDAIAVEADWPDALRINRYIGATPSAVAAELDSSAEESLEGFKRFPLWMWRNTIVVDLINRLRFHNEHAGPGDKVGFFGLDLYSLRSSMEAVVHYLSRVDPDAAKQARARYS